MIVIFFCASAELSNTVHSEYLYTAAAVEAIKSHATNHANKPMFLYFASQLIHTAWEAPDSFIATCAAAAVDDSVTDDEITYCAMNLMLDEVVGELWCF